VFIENPVRPRHRSASGDFRAISFGAQDLSCLLTPSRLNDVCINDCASLLRQLFDGPHAEQCAILSTYSLANHRGNSDDDQIWRVVKVSRFWTKPKWILPIHRPGGSGHWVLCVINTVSHHIDFFDSFADAGNWLPDIKVLFSMLSIFYTPDVLRQDALSLIFRLVRIAITKSYLIDMTESGWTASPTSVGPFMW
jgi:Ulp1 protease family, C-terminal catalytic domain